MALRNGRRHDSARFGDHVTEFLNRLRFLAAPYKGRLTLGLLFGIVAGLLEPLMVGTIWLVFKIIFPTAQTPSAGNLAWIKHAPGWFQDWINQSLHASQVGAKYPMLLLLCIPVVFLLRGL